MKKTSGHRNSTEYPEDVTNLGSREWVGCGTLSGPIRTCQGGLAALTGPGSRAQGSETQCVRAGLSQCDREDLGAGSNPPPTLPPWEHESGRSL